MSHDVSNKVNDRLLSCPKCHNPLKVVLKDDIEVDECALCGGFWVDMIEENDLLRIKNNTFSIDELKRLRELYQAPSKIEEIRYRKCPICSEVMHRKNWGSYSGVIVDVCKKHGKWYDDGELEKIREFINFGGIEYEKLRAVEAGLNDLDFKLTEKSMQLDKKIDSKYLRARWYSILGF